MTSRVSSKNNEKRPKGKKALKKERPNRKKKQKRYKETENNVAGS